MRLLRGITGLIQVGRASRYSNLSRYNRRPDLTDTLSQKGR